MTVTYQVTTALQVLSASAGEIRDRRVYIVQLSYVFFDKVCFILSSKPIYNEVFTWQFPSGIYQDYHKHKGICCFGKRVIIDVCTLVNIATKKLSIPHNMLAYRYLIKLQCANKVLAIYVSLLAAKTLAFTTVIASWVKPASPLIKLYLDRITDPHGSPKRKLFLT